MKIPNLDCYPLNKLAFVAKLIDLNPLTGEQRPLAADAVVKAFVAETAESAAAAIGPAAEVDLVYIGLDERREYSEWLVLFPGALLTPELMNAHFENGGTGYVIIYDNASSVRASVKFIYHDTADPVDICKK